MLPRAARIRDCGGGAVSTDRRRRIRAFVPATITSPCHRSHCTGNLLHLSQVRPALGEKRLAVVAVPWLRHPRLWSEQLLADRLELLFGQQTGFQGGFAVPLLAGRNDDVQVSRQIVDQALDRSKRGI